jgi:alginate O-acetyltransferase complex protein AlgI
MFHGTLLIVERATGQRPTDPHVTHAVVRRSAVFIAVVLGWVVFRAPDLSVAADYFGALFSPDFAGAAFDASITTRAKLVLAIGLASVVLPGRLAVGPCLERLPTARGHAGRLAYTAALLPISLLLVASTTFSPFLYFQF